MIKIVIYIVILSFVNFLNANEITIIELNNKSIDQLINEKNNDKNEILSKEVSNDEQINIEDQNNNITKNDELKQTNDQNDFDSSLNTSVNELPGLWEQINKEDLIFLFKNISKIQSKILKKELLSSLNINTGIPVGFEKDEFNKLIINILLKLGDRKKAYELINSFKMFGENERNIFYNEFIINYLLSTYDLKDACFLRNQNKDLKSITNIDFFLKVDIFCLALEEKFDEANLLNSLLLESNVTDIYFQSLLEKLQNNNLDIVLNDNEINEKNIFLYSAMHRIGNLPLTPKFLDIDPINLSMPIILSSSSNIQLRIKSAHFAFFNNLISEDSLAALYQTVDFTYDDLNNPSNYIKSINNNVEIGMSYFYQLINIQLLPKTRIQAMLQFWEFAEKHNLEKIAYILSLKNLQTIDFSNDFANYGPKIAKAYVVNKNFEKAEKWILFTETALNNQQYIDELNSIKFLLSLSNYNEDKKFTDILLNNLNKINESSLLEDMLEKNEYLYLIFSSLGEIENNNFKIQKKVIEEKKMPSLYLLDIIRDSIVNNNSIQLLLSILVTMDNKHWNDLHPEHFRLILLALKNYKDGILYNDVLFEILKDNKII